MAGTLDDNRAEYEKVRIAPGPHDDAAIKESELVKTSKKHAIYIYIYIVSSGSFVSGSIKVQQAVVFMWVEDERLEYDCTGETVASLPVFVVYTGSQPTH